MVVSVGFSWEECTESETEFAGNPNVWNNFKRLLLVIFFILMCCGGCIALWKSCSKCTECYLSLSDSLGQEL